MKFISGIQKVRTAQRVVSRKNKKNKKQCGVGVAGIKCATLYLYHWNRLSETRRTFYSHSRGDWLWKLAKLKDWHQQWYYNFCWELPQRAGLTQWLNKLIYWTFHYRWEYNSMLCTFKCKNAKQKHTIKKYVGLHNQYILIINYAMIEGFWHGEV